MNTDFRSTCILRKIPIISINTEKFLSKFLQLHKPTKCLEIGSAVGYSTIFLSKEIQKRNGQIYSFERSYPSYIEALQNFSKLSLKNITLYPFNFLEINLDNFFVENFDFVFVDGQKAQYGEYLEKFWPLIENGTPILIDDVIKYHNKLESLYEFLTKNQINYEVFELEDDDGVMIVKK